MVLRIVHIYIVNNNNNNNNNNEYVDNNEGYLSFRIQSLINSNDVFASVRQALNFRNSLNTLNAIGSPRDYLDL
ncbi:unnamed protein product [Schistosoma curassoni]|uniref:Uncharacterized protein n=1 Tax=Schistosoma curassoni TaxID=6186 RepID=A0A183KZN0_9TREM|nr:unnamed protein product [Schistosoma curassoni]